MASDDYTRIKVGGQAVGIIGLKQALSETAEKMTCRADDDIKAELFTRLSKNNYISEKIKDQYARVFLREFKKYMGEPVEKEISEYPEIKVLGPGCANCDRLERDVMAVVNETGIIADIEHVTDVKEISAYGVMGTPALVINGNVVSVGSVPSKSKIKELLNKALTTK